MDADALSGGLHACGVVETYVGTGGDDVMSRQTVGGTADSTHAVQLFDAADSLGEAVAAFLRTGLEEGGRLVMVAKTSSVRDVLAALERSGVSLTSLVEEEHLTILDARERLRAVMRRGSPDPRLFDAHIADLVLQRAVEGRPLYVYGEVVELLAEEGNFQAAIDLEDLWNGLRAAVPFRLLCGYSSAHFASPYAGAALRRVCERHTHVHQSPGDALGAWLLDASSGAVPPSAS